MSESCQNRILDAVESNLRAMAGDGGQTFWYTPTAVVQAPYFDDATCLHPVAGRSVYDPVGPPAVVYVLVPDVEKIEQDNNAEESAKLRFYLWAAIQTGDDPGPHRAVQPKHGTLQGRLANDAKNKLNSGNQRLGVPTLSVLITEVDRGVATLFPGWACVVMTVDVEFVYQRRDP